MGTLKIKIFKAAWVGLIYLLREQCLCPVNKVDWSGRGSLKLPITHYNFEGGYRLNLKFHVQIFWNTTNIKFDSFK